MTRKLYYEDPYLVEFTASVTKRGIEADGTPYAVLDQTAFYPAGGGQPCDLGTLGSLNVTDVEEVDGEIRHRLCEPLPETVAAVQGEIDWSRRFDHMQQHNGQHIFSAACEHLFDADTIGFHLGRETVTVDLTLPDLTQERVEAIEYLCNKIVFDNRPIEARFVEREEAAQMPMRKPPTVTENIRVVIIPDFDYNGCGGTHPSRTGETGPIKILSWERYKGNVRVHFVCGWRALKAMTEKQLVLKRLNRHLNSGEAEMESSVVRLISERKELERALQDAKSRLLDSEALGLLEGAQTRAGLPVVAAAFAERPMQELQKLAQAITAKNPHALALLVAGGAKIQLVFARGTEASLPVNELLRHTLRLIDGKGGGNASAAQGGGVTDKTPSDVLAEALMQLEQHIPSD